jgi:hypothetical protein
MKAHLKVYRITFKWSNADVTLNPDNVKHSRGQQTRIGPGAKRTVLLGLISKSFWMIKDNHKLSKEI